MGISGQTELRKSQEEEEVQVRRQADGRSQARGLLNEVGLGKVQAPGECRRQKAFIHFNIHWIVHLYVRQVASSFKPFSHERF